MFIRATVWRAWRTVKKLPIVNWTMLLKLDHSATTDVPLRISKLLKLLQREVLDVSMIDLLNVKWCWTPDNWVLKELGQPCQNELAAGSFTLPVEYLQALRLDNVKWKPHKFMPLLPTDYYYKHFDWTKKIKTALFYLKFVQESFYSILCWLFQ